MIRAGVVTAATAVGVVLLLSLKPHDEPPTGSTAAPPATTPIPRTSPDGSPVPKPSNAGVTGTFEGDTVTTQQGPVQVRATFSGGRLTSVDVLKGVHDQGPSVDAVPVLTERALSAQSADIDAVSGATYTSEGYISSLQSALDQARA
ncbi:FMN-binding protein [Streptomyces sp. NBC_00467]|uniref:FMN-binding protein n=1 Tax=Streptomyces sp. NBC_00467 TaxID=2975752 RepID=UPI002E17F2C6